MKDVSAYDALIVVTAKDYRRVARHYKRILQDLPAKRVTVVGSEEVLSEMMKDDLPDEFTFIDENAILPFDAVYEAISERMAEVLAGRELPRGIAGWYYQQFLKMSYADYCADDYYMVWDGDTIPCHPFSMFSEQGKPYLDVKNEYVPAYFSTMEKLIPGLTKLIGPSFISEHMLFRTKLMQELLEKIEANDEIPGQIYWQKILNVLTPEELQTNSFSEFETYGSYMALAHADVYRLREWHSFRLGAEFFDVDTICDRDFAWLGRDFDAISFEKNLTVREDHKNLFDNPEYQAKMSARQMLENAQKEFKEGNIEKWGMLGN